MAERAGFENRSHSTPNDSPLNDLEQSPERVWALCWAFLERERPDLARIVRAWDILPEPSRAAMLALVSGFSG